MPRNASNVRKRKAQVGRAVPSALSGLEADVMDVVWARGEVSVRCVMEAMNDGSSNPRAYTTYMTMMVRLEGKGVVRRRRAGKTDCYSAVFSREEFQAVRAESEIDAIVREYGAVALTQFARRIASLDPARRDALERLAGGERDQDPKG